MPVILEQKPSTLAPTFTVPAPTPTKHIAFDIETGHATKEAIELSQQFAKAAANIKDAEKAAANVEKKRDGMEEKSALLDLAPISCAAFVTENAQAIFTHKGYPWPKKLKAVTELKGYAGTINVLKDEREMLLGIREWLEYRAMPASILIGHAIKGFDLPKLRGAYVRYGLALPQVMRPEARDAGVEVYDTMDMFTRYFTAEQKGQKYITLEETVARLGIPSHKQWLSGAAVPDKVAAGDMREILTYCHLDVLLTYSSFLAMASLSKDRPA